MESLIKKQVKIKKILQKPSGTIAVNGDLEALERKFYNGLLYNAKQQLEEDITRDRFKIPFRKLMEFLNINESDKNYSYYKKVLNKLFSTTVYYNILKKDKTIIEEGKAHLIDNLTFKNDEKTKEILVYYTIPNLVKDAIIDIIKGNLNSMYAKIDLMIIKGFKSKYSIILYELCKDYQNVEIPEMTIQQFKEIFGIEDKKSYNIFPNLKQYVIKPAIDEINKNQEINFSVKYKLKKQGRSYSHIKFIIEPKEKINTIEKNIKESKNENIENIISLLPNKFKTEKIISIIKNGIKEKGQEYIKAQIFYVIDRYNDNKINNIEAYLKCAIAEDYASFKDFIVSKKEKQQKEEEDKIREEELKFKELFPKAEQIFNKMTPKEQQELIKKKKDSIEMFKKIEMTLLHQQILKRMVINDIIKKLLEEKNN